MFEIACSLSQAPRVKRLRAPRGHPKSFGGLNPLGLYRSIIENEKLTLEEKIEVRDYAYQTFLKSFNFLQLKDPTTYFEVSTLGQTLSRAEELQLDSVPSSGVIRSL